MYIHKKAKIGAELSKAYAFIDDMFGPGITPFEDVERMQKKNPNFIHAIFNEKSGDVVGYFSFVPLTKDAEEKMGLNELHGAELTTNDIQDPEKRPYGYYLGAVAALSNSESRFVTMRFLLAYLHDYVDPSLPFYTRPITDDGHRLCLKKGFVPVVEAPDAQGRLIYRLV